MNVSWRDVGTVSLVIAAVVAFVVVAYLLASYF
jgi:hypothetical protein